jgi:hypothetical protein
MVKTRQQREDYALHRMGLAIERILGGGSKEEKRQATWWIGVWKACHAFYLAKHKPRSASVH